MARREETGLDRDLADLPPDLRWREWMRRIEAVLFASGTPVARDDLARVVGQVASVDLLIEDLAVDLEGRPYEVAQVGGGWMLRTKTTQSQRPDSTDRPLTTAKANKLRHYHTGLTRYALGRSERVGTRVGVTRLFKSFGGAHELTFKGRVERDLGDARYERGLAAVSLLSATPDPMVWSARAELGAPVEGRS